MLSARAVVFIVAIFYAKRGKCELLCYECDGVDSIEECTTLKKCKPSESCCDQNTSLSGSVKCAECCDGDYCNNNLCQEKGNGIPCFTCNHIRQSEECSQIKYCKSDETCGTFYYANHTMKTILVSYHCESKSTCSKAHKRISEQELYQIQGDCCSSPHCNRPSGLTPATPTTKQPKRCSVTSTTATSPITTTPITATLTTKPILTTTKPTVTSTTTTATSTTTRAAATTKPVQGVDCETCSGGICGVIPQPTKTCPHSAPYCMNIVENSASGRKTYTKRCASNIECQKKWWEESSDERECQQFDKMTPYSFKFTCSYCCVTPRCNMKIYPDRNTLFKGTN